MADKLTPYRKKYLAKPEKKALVAKSAKIYQEKRWALIQRIAKEKCMTTRMARNYIVVNKISPLDYEK